MISQRLTFKVLGSIFKQSFADKLIFSFANDNDKYQKYQYPFNINRQQYRGYIKKVQKAKKQIQQVEQRESKQILPRRKRRVYDKPRIDIDTTGYAAWTLYDPEFIRVKTWEHGSPVTAKLQLQPKWLIHAFGLGNFSINNSWSSHREHIFEDNNFSRFVLYEYRNTTHFKKNIQNYDYENQSHLRPQMRKVKRIQPQVFWQSEDYFQFRINSTHYAEDHKFCQYIKQQIEKRKTQQSFDEMIDKKFGKAMTYNEKADVELFRASQPFIRHVNAQSYQIKKDQKETKDKKQKKETKDSKDQKETKEQKKARKKQKQQKPVAQIAVISKEPVSDIPKKAFAFAGKLDQKYRKQVQVKKSQKKAQAN